MGNSDERYPDLDAWCGHFLVSLENWRCPDCECSLSQEAKQRLLSAQTIAPHGSFWVFHQQAQPGFERQELDDVSYASLFTDRSKIPSILIKGSVCSAKDLRKELQSIHWYQGVYNEALFEGWTEGGSESPTVYRLYLAAINEFQ